MALFRSTFQRGWMLFAVVFLATAISQAAIIAHTDRGTFANLLAPGYYHENFDSPGYDFGDQGGAVTTGELAGTGNVQPGAAFHFTIATPATDANTLFVLGDPEVNGNYPFGTRGQAMCTLVSGPLKELVLTFTSDNVTAVGASFSLTDGAEDRASGNFNILLTFGGPGDPGDQPFSLSTTATDGVPFQGFRTDGTYFIESITFTPTTAGTFATMDDLHVGAVPEPAATGIAAALLCLLIAGRGVLLRVCAKLWSRVA